MPRYQLPTILTWLTSFLSLAGAAKLDHLTSFPPPRPPTPSLWISLFFLLKALLNKDAFNIILYYHLCKSATIALAAYQPPVYSLCFIAFPRYPVIFGGTTSFLLAAPGPLHSSSTVFVPCTSGDPSNSSPSYLRPPALPHARRTPIPPWSF